MRKKIVRDDVHLLQLIWENANFGRTEKEDRYIKLPDGRILKVGPADNSHEAIVVSGNDIGSLRDAILKIKGGEEVVFRYEYPEGATLCLNFALEEGDS